MRRRMMGTLLMAALLLGLLEACSGAAPGRAVEDGRLQVVATTSIVGDVVRQVGGEWIDLLVLIPQGSDPHSFQATPQDMAKLAEADVIFANGAGLEAFLPTVVKSVGRQERVVELAEAVPLRQLEADHRDTDGEHEGETGVDPHVWLDPNNVMIWADEIARVLGDLDPEHRAGYQANAGRYRDELSDLDAWIRDQVASIPEARRKIVTDHAVWGYFADRYGFEQVGALLPGFSTLSEPSASDLAALSQAIREQEVPAIFVGTTTNPALARQLANDLGIRVVEVLTGSLSPEAPDYLSYMRYNVSRIVEALSADD